MTTGSSSIYSRVQALIEETNEAFAQCRGSINADYAEFASMALSDFKKALQDPNLTSAQLKVILRRAMLKNRDSDPVTWPELMALHVACRANENERTTW